MAGSQNKEDHTFSTLELVDLQSGSMGRIQAHDEGSMSAAVLSPNGTLIAFQVDASTVKLVDTVTWRSRYTFDASSDRNSDNASLRRFLVTVKSVMALAFSPDGKVVSGEIEQGGIKSWDTRTGEVKKQFAEHDETGSIADISANPSMVVEASSDEALRLWNVASGEKKTLSGVGEEVSAVALSPDGATLAVGSANRITLIATQTQKTIQTLPGSHVNCLSFSADGRSLASATENGSIEVWDVASGRHKQTISSGGGKINALRFSPNGRVLASANADKTVALWDSQSGALIMQLKKHSAAVNTIAFSFDGILIATGGDDRSVIIWEAATGKARHTLKGHDMTVTSIAFSPDATVLASGSGNASVVLWDVRSGRLDRVLR